MTHKLDYANKPPKYNNYKNRAKNKFPNDKMISKEEFNAIAEKACHYCGKKGPNGIDRTDNLKGYTKTNCVACCKHCNYVKGDLSITDFKKWTERFVKKQCSCNYLKMNMNIISQNSNI